MYINHSIVVSRYNLCMMLHISTTFDILSIMHTFGIRLSYILMADNEQTPNSFIVVDYHYDFKHNNRMVFIWHCVITRLAEYTEAWENISISHKVVVFYSALGVGRGDWTRKKSSLFRFHAIENSSAAISIIMITFYSSKYVPSCEKGGMV